MALVQLAGYVAFIVASLVLGFRLIALWRRTREWPELTIGCAFLLGGACGFVAWLALGILIGAGAPAPTIKLVAISGLAASVLGTLGNGVGTTLIFRPRALWARAFVATSALVMFGCLTAYAIAPAEDSGRIFWLTILLTVPLYAWGGFESITLSRMLRKRARLGLADPLVANRMMLFGVSSVAVVVSIGFGYAAQIAYGLTPPPWTGAAGSSALLVGAGAIWLGFFPPEGYRTRVINAIAGS
jgi:hypothetical protein